jgi:hypothetical protein
MEATTKLQRGNESTHRAGGDQRSEDNSGNRFPLRRTPQPGNELETSSDPGSALRRLWIDDPIPIAAMRR